MYNSPLLDSKKQDVENVDKIYVYSPFNEKKAKTASAPSSKWRLMECTTCIVTARQFAAVWKRW